MAVPVLSTVAYRGNATVALWGLQVVFHLHPTFPNPVREVTQHPFELQEQGWGEFDIQISVRPLAAMLLSVPGLKMYYPCMTSHHCWKPRAPSISPLVVSGSVLSVP